MALQKVAENTMDGSCEQRGCYEENGNKSERLYLEREIDC